MQIYNKILDIIENIKLRITSNEYLELLNELKKIRDHKKWYEHKCKICKDLFPSKNSYLIPKRKICENCQLHDIYSSSSSDSSDTFDLSSSD